MVIAEYIWLGGKNELRSKTKVLSCKYYDFSKKKLVNNCSDKEKYLDLPNWNYDGSSTDQAKGSYSEVVIKPVSVYRCPFRKEDHILVFCNTFKPDGTPLTNNHRVWAKSVFDKNLEEEPWFGVEQEFFLIDKVTKLPLGFPPNGYPNPQGQYYCSVGAENAFGREILEAHLDACLYAGINISGINAEVAPGQWEYQVGPCKGIECGDQVWVSRYILERIAESYHVSISWHPKPLLGDWNGSGCHTNYSTKSTREGTDSKTGYEIILEHMKKLESKHKEHMDLYGTHNRLRMTGNHETADFYIFNYGEGNRGASVRIGYETIQNKKGYYEDRRPSSNMDPYLVSAKLFETTVLE